MRDEDNNDIESAGLCLYMQAGLCLGNASYYKMKLQVHNFTIYINITHKFENCIWDETELLLLASIQLQ